MTPEQRREYGRQKYAARKQRGSSFPPPDPPYTTSDVTNPVGEYSFTIALVPDTTQMDQVFKEFKDRCDQVKGTLKLDVEDPNPFEALWLCCDLLKEIRDDLRLIRKKVIEP